MDTFFPSEGIAGERADERLHFVLQTSQRMAYEQDRDLRYTWAANAVCGLSDDEVVGHRDADVLDDPAQAAALSAAKHEVMRTGAPAEQHVPITVDGTTRRCMITIAPLYNTDAEIVGVRGTVADHTDALEHEEALERARYQAREAQEKAEDARRVMSMVLGNASHALLTPLSGMLSLIDALRARNIDALEEPLTRIRKSGQRLQRAIERLLDLSALEAGEAQLQAERIDVRMAVDDAAELLRQRATEEDIDFDVRMPSEPVRAELDPSALRRVARNLVSNAIKYTHEGGVTVELTTEADGAVVCLQVADTGEGISDAFLPSLFEPFSRAETGNVSGGGTGLGLAITKRFVDAMGGTIDVETAVEEGSTFTVRLPASPSNTP